MWTPTSGERRSTTEVRLILPSVQHGQRPAPAGQLPRDRGVGDIAAIARDYVRGDDIRQAQVAHYLGDNLRYGLGDAEIAGQMLDPLIKIVEPATASRDPIRPRKTLNFGLCLLAGFTVGTGLAFMREGLNRTIRTPQDVSEHLQLPVLGLIRKGL